MLFLERSCFLLATLPNNLYLFSLFLILLLWTLTFHLLSQAFRVLNMLLLCLLQFLWAFQVWTSCEFAGTSVYVCMYVFHVIFVSVEWWTKLFEKPYNPLLGRMFGFLCYHASQSQWARLTNCQHFSLYRGDQISSVSLITDQTYWWSIDQAHLTIGTWLWRE